jgi:hypothetical protein
MPPACVGAGERRLVLKPESDWQPRQACLWSPSIHVAGRCQNVAHRTKELGARGGEGM